MRQAGRSLPEYKEVRGEGSINQAIADPDRATEITLQPVRRYGVDAAILFSDIVTPVHAIDFGIDIKPGVGPVADRPIRGKDDLQRLRPLDPDADAVADQCRHWPEAVRVDTRGAVDESVNQACCGIGLAGIARPRSLAFC